MICLSKRKGHFIFSVLPKIPHTFNEKQVMAKKKKCKKCGKNKTLNEFYVDKNMIDERCNTCKDCCKERGSIRYYKKSEDDSWMEKERERGRAKYRRLYAGTGKAKPVDNQRWRNKFPEKAKAINHSANLEKPFLEAERHHWSYHDDHLKDVIWLTKKEHMKAHRFLVYDQEQRLYRRCDNMELLDTKGKHEKYIRHCIKTKAD
jgi:hypothetical protein